MTIQNQNQVLSLDLGGRFNSYASTSGKFATPAISNVKVQPVVLFAILDHYLRRQEGQSGVIGTLLGVRSEDGSLLEIRNCFPVPHNETDDQVAVDMDHHRKMFDLHQKVNDSEVIVGWYATGPTLNPYSALIQDFYNTEVERQEAVHLVMDTSLQGDKFGAQVFTSSPIGFGKTESCVFRQLPCDIQLHRAERSGLDLLCSKNRASVEGESTENIHSLLTDSTNLIKSIRQIQSMLTRVLKYIESVLDGGAPSNPAIGRYLMDTLAMVPKIDAEIFDKTFNSHVQDLLMVIYLSNVTRAQLALADSIHSLV
ncbi:hypothetical protein DSO57_1001473 [Entomophthora muscae]|uniref:Uncharacterized protein n=1 Tax=Entomophthora muscae TaxID=34485 RepID=A0ACC2UIU6_9FUNG|nr:hypothetical protein DSO57_1001473 [Entomophthora muscae]